MAFDLVEALIRTQALRLAPPGGLFWYTSGTVGPYYINTHYLFGGPGPATELLEFIEREKGDGAALAASLHRRAVQQCDSDADYRAVIELLAAGVRAGGGPAPACVSGGERRDWFFSAALAARLGLPHLLLFKQQGPLLYRPEAGAAAVAAGGLEGAAVAHAADLVTEASSYTRSWIPAVRQAGGLMVRSVNVVDRGQGGIAAIEAAGVPAAALVRVDGELFARLLAAGVIDRGQHDLLEAYYADPRGSMRAFLEAHPEFLRQALHGDDAKTAARARLLVDTNPYDLDLPRLGLG